MVCKGGENLPIKKNYEIPSCKWIALGCVVDHSLQNRFGLSFFKITIFFFPFFLIYTSPIDLVSSSGFFLLSIFFLNEHYLPLFSSLFSSAANTTTKKKLYHPSRPSFWCCVYYTRWWQLCDPSLKWLTRLNLGEQPIVGPRKRSTWVLPSTQDAYYWLGRCVVFILFSRFAPFCCCCCCFLGQRRVSLSFWHAGRFANRCWIIQAFTLVGQVPSRCQKNVWRRRRRRNPDLGLYAERNWLSPHHQLSSEFTQGEKGENEQSHAWWRLRSSNIPKRLLFSILTVIISKRVCREYDNDAPRFNRRAPLG